MASQGSKITASDFTSLKNLVNSEIGRRGKAEGTGQNQSYGSLSSYSGSDYQYTTTPAAGVKILREHITKITQPLDAVTGGGLTPGNGAAVTASTLTTAASKVATLSGKGVTSSDTGCKSSCSGLCSSGCYNGCKTTCTGSCVGNCTGTCSELCSGGCDVTCDRSCAGGCYGGCDGSCSGCSGDCGSGCDSSCSGTCDGCNITCTSSCGTSGGGFCGTACIFSGN